MLIEATALGLWTGVRSVHLDLWDVQEAGRAADEGAPWEAQLGDGLQAPLVQGPGPILQHRAALQQCPDLGVLLPALELLVGAQVGVFIVQRHYIPVP